MEITGSQTIDAPRAAVWDALNDPETLMRCLPGCESVERASAEEFRIILTAAVGPLRARFNGVLNMTEADPPKSCVMTFEGQGGAMGFGKGSSSITLNETTTGTELVYTANAQVGGKLAQVGSRLIDSVAKKMSNDFFKKFCLEFAPAEAAEEPAERDGLLVEPAVAACAPISTARPAGVRVQARRDVAATNVTVVPGWWLAVALALGAAAAIAGMLVGH